MKSIFEKYQKIFLYILIFITIIFFVDTIFKGLENSCDFQWQPATLFWEGINHYEKFIKNGKYDFMCQGGEYAHLLNIIYYPFALLKWETAKTTWLIFNIFFTFFIPFLICHKFKISNYKTIILILIFMSSHPTRMTINYGQQSLLVMFFLMLPFIFKSSSSYFFSGFSSIKYSTGYILFLNFLASKEYKKFILATIPYFLGWLIYSFYTNSDPLVNFFEPFRWFLRLSYERQAIDLYTLGELYFSFKNNILYKSLLILLIFLINFFVLTKINKIKDDFLKMSLVFICPLIFFPHSNYDYVLLLPLACYSLHNFEKFINKINFYFVIYIFFFNRIFKHLLDLDWLYKPVLLLALVFVLLFNIKIYLKTNPMLTNV